MCQKIYTSRLLIHQAARALDNDDADKIQLAAMAKKGKRIISSGN
jgi:hypothetical protein